MIIRYLTALTVLQYVNIAETIEKIPNFLLNEIYLKESEDIENSGWSEFVPVISDNSLQKVINFTALGYDFTCRLEVNPTLVPDDFVILLKKSNRTSELLHFHPNHSSCFYRGVVERRGPIIEIGTAALDMCNGMRGIIRVQQQVYVLKPKKNIGSQHVIKLLNQFNPATNEKHCSNGDSLNTINTNYDDTLFFEHRRTKREVPPEGSRLYMEIAVFVDQHLFNHMKTNFPKDTESEVINVVLAMINAVQLLYNDESLGYFIDIVLKRLEILDTDPLGLIWPYDIDTFLTVFCDWQREENPSADSDPFHWDHALMLTGLDLYTIDKSGKINTQVVGLAPVGGMCTRSSSCTVNEGRHFETVYVVAHELGHSLGMRHDGPQAANDCDPGAFIMSPTLGSGKTTWSPCSKYYLQQFLVTNQAQCLFDRSTASTDLDHSGMNKLPGERFSADQQCVLKYGRSSNHSPTQPLADICRDLHCRKDFYAWTSHPALEGTYCGQNKWCRRGVCVEKNGASNSIIPVDGAWSDWSTYSDCASGCLYGQDGYLRTGSVGITISRRRCDSPYPDRGGKQCYGAETRYRTCTAASQCFAVKKMTVEEYANEVCFRAAEYQSELLGVGVQRPSHDPSRSCTVWCLRRDGGYFSLGWTFPDGTMCSSTKRGKEGNYCIEGKCEQFTCHGNQYLLDDGKCRSRELDSNLAASKSLSWSIWQPTGECKVNCISPSSGVQIVNRVCLSSECDGLFSSLQLCRNKKKHCSKEVTLTEYASEVCRRYKTSVKFLSGLGMQLPATIDDSDRPCKVACQDTNIHYRFYKTHGESGWFPFGTDCSGEKQGRTAYCLMGKCMEFGGDKTPLRKYDPLFQAGSKEYSVYKRSKRDADIPQGHSSRTSRGKLHYEPLNEIQFSWEKSNEFHFLEDILKNSSDWGELPDIDLSNPVTFFQNRNEVRRGRKMEEPITGLEGAMYSWQMLISDCSVTCGKGTQEVIVQCVSGGTIVSNVYCDPRSQPDIPGYRPCNAPACSESSEPQDTFMRRLLHKLIGPP